jgi:DNA repair photolyase
MIPIQRADPLRSLPVTFKGRGAQAATPHRFEQLDRETFDDGWPVDAEWSVAAVQGPHQISTQVIIERARTALTRNDSPDIAFDQALNPYRGCEHGCSYCYARPTHSYLGYSPGLDFETKIVAKTNLPELLDRTLSRPSYIPRSTNIGSATDCYQPIERELLITRQILEVMQRHNHPFSIITKSSGIERDLDLLAPMASTGLAAVYVTITTLDPALARKMEPRAASPRRRLDTIRRLAQAGVPVGVSVAPQIPFLNEDMECVLTEAAQAGASTAFYTVLRLPWELNEVFGRWLVTHYPDRADRIMARVRDMRRGDVYRGEFGSRMKGQGVWADLLKQRFERACSKLGLNERRSILDLSQFVHVTDSRQTSLFGSLPRTP